MPNMPGKAGKGESAFPGPPRHAGGRRSGSSPRRAGPHWGAAGSERAAARAAAGPLPCVVAEAGAVTFRGHLPRAAGGGESYKYSTARGAGPLARMRRRGCRRGARRARTHTPPPRTAAISRNRPQTGSPAPTHCPTASPERSNIKHKHISSGSDAC